MSERRNWRAVLKRFTGGAGLEPLGYALFAAAVTLWVGCRFYASMRLQTGYTAASGAPFAQHGEWSAPLDDVFIHFDFARSAARGFPFHWSEGNGYSSGGTSLAYPFILTLGYHLGFDDHSLAIWAAVVACVSVFAVLLGVRRAFVHLPRWTSYLAPVALLSIGALSWTLFSGMEVAVFLAFWAGALLAWDDLLWQRAEGSQDYRAPAILLGMWGLLVAATRPEGATLVAIFALSASAVVFKRSSLRRALFVMLAAALPAGLLVVGQALANKLLTGDSTAAGALVKLELHHPHFAAQQIYEAWVFHLKYQVLRITHYHLSAIPALGWIVWVFAAAALVSERTRRYALLLWTSALVWTLVVGLNGQVRWQNERYSMPALAWLLLAAALGAGAMLSPARASWLERRWLTASRVAVCIVAMGVFAWQQEPRFSEQVWFFGRASRNIRDQHVRVGRFINQLDPKPRRVLVGDAGAIPYAADVPALDIIGLGGFKGLPFARASRLGVGAALELVERMRPAERPDLLALYPSWWDPFPLWFGRRIAEFAVDGNVICGGLSKVLYAPDWSPFDGSSIPSTLLPGESVVDAVDVADLVSEREHEYRLSRRDAGYVQMKILPNPRRPAQGLWDAGRLVGPGITEHFTLQELTPGRPTRLVFRLAPAQATRISVDVDGNALGVLEVPAKDGWSEPTLTIPADLVQARTQIGLRSLETEHILYHVWAIQHR